MKNFDLSKIKLIVGLGNAEQKYIYTRHNTGFLFLDYITQTVFLHLPKFKCYISEIKVGDSAIRLIKPTTMMNNSGEAVNLVSSFYKYKPKEILVVHDDLDLKLGEYKIQFAKKPKVHNGIESVETHLNSDQFWRIRIGIDNRDTDLRKNISGADYVLGKFSKEELEILKSTFEKIVKEITHDQ